MAGVVVMGQVAVAVLETGTPQLPVAVAVSVSVTEQFVGAA